MRAWIHCEDCGIDLAHVDGTYEELCHLLPAQILVCHAAPPHASCALSFRLEPPTGPNLPCKITCVDERCNKPGKPPATPFVAHVPIELVNTVGWVFHTAHEGHRARVEYDGWVIESPEPED